MKNLLLFMRYNMIGCISLLLLTPLLLFSQPAAGDLIWHTFQGGAGADEAYAIDSDAAGNFYIVGKGWTDWDMAGQPVITPVNSHNPPNAHGNREFDVFVAKFTNGGELVWYTFLGDADENDDGYDIAVDSQGNIFVVGIIRSWYL